MPGHHDARNECTSLEDAKKATRDAMELGLAGKTFKYLKVAIRKSFFVYFKI